MERHHLTSLRASVRIWGIFSQRFGSAAGVSVLVSALGFRSEFGFRVSGSCALLDCWGQSRYEGRARTPSPHPFFVLFWATVATVGHCRDWRAFAAEWRGEEGIPRYLFYTLSTVKVRRFPVLGNAVLRTPHLCFFIACARSFVRSFGFLRCLLA